MTKSKYGPYTTVHFKEREYQVYENGNIKVVVRKQVKHPWQFSTYLRTVRPGTPIFRMVKHMASNQPKDESHD